MKITIRTGTPTFDLHHDDLKDGSVYYSAENPDSPFIFTDEGLAVDLDSGTQWEPDSSDRFREVNAQVVIE
jgi:hypothetical protein